MVYISGIILETRNGVYETLCPQPFVCFLKDGTLFQDKGHKFEVYSFTTTHPLPADQILSSLLKLFLRYLITKFHSDHLEGA